MALRSTTIRFDDFAHKIIAEEARRAGMSLSQFVREAALIRAVLRQLARLEGFPPIEEHALAFEAMSEKVIELARVEGNNHES